MRRTLSALAVLATLGLGVVGMSGTASAAGAAGAGISQPATSATTDVQKVNHRWDHRGRHYDRRWDRRGPPRHWGGPRSGVYFQFGTAPRVYRAPPRRAYGGMSRAHVNWCYSRYRSYDVNTNTFQPYNGPRRACYSPYS